jgi:hypothetical protein
LSHRLGFGRKTALTNGGEYGALRLAEAFADSPLRQRQDERAHGNVVVFIQDRVGAGAYLFAGLGLAELLDQ